MTTHKHCTHPATSAARAACRRRGAGSNAITASGTAYAHTRAAEAKYGPRTDEHRPSVFDPEAYEFDHCGTWSSDEFLADVRREAAAARGRMRAEGWTIARHQHTGQCGHCG